MIRLFTSAKEYASYKQTELRRRPPGHTTLEKLDEDFSLKTHLMFSVYNTPEKFKHATITGHSGFVFEKNSVINIVRSSFSKIPVFKMFSDHTKTKSRHFQISPV